MKKATTLFLAPWLALAASGCSGGGGSKPKNPPAECKGTNVKAAEKNNYQFSSTLTFPPIKVQPKTELSFDWSGVTEKDFLGHPLDARKDINMISVLSWGLSLSDLEAGLNADSLPQSALTTTPLALTTDGKTPNIPEGATSAKLFQFTVNGTPIEPGTSVSPERILEYFDADLYPPEVTSYLIMAATGIEVGQGARMIQSFLLDKGSTNTEVRMTSSSTRLTWKANLRSLTPVGIPPHQASITFDWTDSISKNALGATFEPTYITNVLVGHYSESVAQLEGKFLDIELIATEIYQGTVETGTSIDLSTLKDKNNNAFSGIDDTGTWLVALRCSTALCRNPAPWYLTILKAMPDCQ